MLLLFSLLELLLLLLLLLGLLLLLLLLVMFMLPPQLSFLPVQDVLSFDFNETLYRLSGFLDRTRFV